MVILSPIIQIYTDFRLILGNKILLVLALMSISAILETVGLFIFIPLIILSFGNPEAVPQNELIKDNIAEDIIKMIFKLLNLESSFQNLMLIIILFFVSKAIFSFLSLTYAGLLRSNLLHQLKTKFYEGISEIDFPNFLKLDQGRILSTVGDNINRTAQAFHNFMQFGTQSVNFLVFITGAIYISPFASFGFIIISGMLYFLFRYLNKLSVGYSKRFVEENNKYISLMKTQINNQKYFSAVKKRDHFHKKLKKTVLNLSKTQYSVGLVKALISAIREPVALLVIILFIFLNISIFRLEGSQLFTALFLIYRATNSLVGMQATWSNTLEFNGSFDAVSAELSNIQKGKMSVQDSRSLLKNDSSLVKLENVNYAYDSNHSFKLENICLNLEKNKVYGIVGRSGSGKTTLIDLILDLITPSSGKIMDGFDNSQASQAVGYVPQEIILIPGTIKENVCLFESSNDMIDRDWLEEVIRLSGLSEFIASLPDGLETTVLDEGENFSGGQRQRIMIARELYRKTDILILDEPTSGLDYANEAIIINSLSEMKKITSIIIVSHEFNLIKNTDEVIVIENGSIIEVGNPEQLMRRNESKLLSLFDVQQHLLD